MRLYCTAAIALLEIGASAAAAAAPGWKVTELAGDVRVRNGGETRPAVKGQILASGSLLATGPTGRAVIVRGEEIAVISPRSQVRLAGDDAPKTIIQVIEDFGTILFKIQKKTTPHFGVQTPYLAAIVKGTTFTVTVGAEGGTVQVTEGAVQVSTLDGGAVELVRPGMIATVGANDAYRLKLEGPTSKVLRSPAAPLQSSLRGRPAPASARYAGPRAQEVRLSKTYGEDKKVVNDARAAALGDRFSADAAQAEFGQQARTAVQKNTPSSGGGGKGTPALGDVPGSKQTDPRHVPAIPSKPADFKNTAPGKPDPTRDASASKPVDPSPFPLAIPASPGTPPLPPSPPSVM